MVKLMTAKFPSPLAAKQTQIITPAPLCLTAGMRSLHLYAVFGVVQYGQTSPLWSHVYKGLCSRGLVVGSNATL